ncbi:MAG: ABC transporter permease [Gemmataceae bacterium]|nr:ABC transporter permease [Gemmataceae bacterium]
MEATAFTTAYYQRIWKLRWFWFSLVQNDLDLRYRHSVLGVGWSLLKPLGLTIILCVVFGRIFQIPIAEYAPYVLIGLTLWHFIVESVALGAKTFTTGAAYIRQQAVPLAIFPLRTTLGGAFHLGVALSLGIVVTWYFKGFGNLAALPAIVPGLLVLFLLGWSMATVCGLMQTHFPDTIYILELLLQFTFYLTPIIYRPGELRNQPRLSWIVDCNPFWSVMELIRQPVLYGQAPPLYNVAVSLGFVTILVVLALICLRKLERTLVFWI